MAPAEAMPFISPSEHFTFEKFGYGISNELKVKNKPIQIYYQAPESSLPIVVSYQSISDYINKRCIPGDALGYVSSNHLSVAEVGGGLAELIPYLAIHTDEQLYYIDPLNLDIVHDLLGKAKQKKLNENDGKLVDELIERAIIIATHPHIRRFPMTLQEAFAIHQKELYQAANVVVDVNGATTPWHSPDVSWAQSIEAAWMLDGDPELDYWGTTHLQFN
ncbi:MAG TPA: hypothetical protein VMR81_03845 [Patescibacteria group bacterium]|nr:hypothetical protein [Patescibacteria group bacterium]